MPSSSGPLPEGCEPLRFSSMVSNLFCYRQLQGLRPMVNLISNAVRPRSAPLTGRCKPASINVRSARGAKFDPGVGMGIA